MACKPSSKRARPRRSSGPTDRAKETAAWKSAWEKIRKQIPASTKAHRGTCEGFYYLETIYSLTNNELVAETMSVLKVFRLDGPDWRRRLDGLSRFEVGGSEDDLALALMRHLIKEKKWENVKRAAERAVAELALYRDANSFEAAVQHAREIWISFKKGEFCPLGELINEKGIFVRPNVKNLRRTKVSHIIDPYDLKPLPMVGKRVPDTTFWRNMIDFGFVVPVDDNL